MHDLLLQLTDAINSNDIKTVRKNIKILNRCGMDTYTIYVILHNSYDVIIDAIQLYQLLKTI